MLYSLAIPVFSLDGGPLSLAASAVNLDVFGNTITDNFGDMGVTAVKAKLLSLLQPISSDSLGFTAPFSITLTVPGMDSTSVLYLSDSTLDVAAVPEPGAMALLAGSGLAGAVFILRQRRGRRSVR